MQPMPSQVMTEFLNSIPGDIVNRFWPRFVQLGVLDLHALSKLSQMQLRQVVPPLGPYRHLYAELQKDWHCEKCGFVNYARYGNADCYRCNHYRTGGKSSTAPLHAANDADSARISAMLAEREQTRRSQDFERADAIREQLRMMGVVWDDDMKTWRTSDGRCGRWGTPSHAAAAAGAAQGGLCIKLRGLPFRVRYDDIRNFFALAGIDILQYSVVLEKNADGRPSGIGYVKVSTQAEQQLACTQLNHKHIPGYDRYAWVVESTEAEYQAAANSWAGAVLNDTPSDGDSLVTSQKLKEREECRKARNYEMADSIRDALRDEGVTFDDELRTWSDKHGNSGRWGLKTPSFSASFGLSPAAPTPMTHPGTPQTVPASPVLPHTPSLLASPLLPSPVLTPLTSGFDTAKDTFTEDALVTPLTARDSDSSRACSWQSSSPSPDTPLTSSLNVPMCAPLSGLGSVLPPGPIGHPDGLECHDFDDTAFERDLASILEVCTEQEEAEGAAAAAGGGAGGGGAGHSQPSQPTSHVTRLQSILFAVADSPISP